MEQTTEDFLKRLRELLEDERKQFEEKGGMVRPTYRAAALFSDSIGEIIARELTGWIKAGGLSGEGADLLELANGTILPSLESGYDQIESLTLNVQRILNKNAGLGLTAQAANFDKAAAENLAKKAAEVAVKEGAARAEWVVDEPVKTFSRKIVDRTLKKNADFQKNAGLNPTIERLYQSGCCKWCEGLAGRYPYGKEPSGFYLRHRKCRCTIIYDPADGRAVQINAKWRG